MGERDGAARQSKYRPDKIRAADATVPELYVGSNGFDDRGVKIRSSPQPNLRWWAQQLRITLYLSVL